MRPQDFDLKWINDEGTEIPPANGLLTVVADTYYAEVPGVGEGGIVSVQICWAATIVADIDFETTNLPPADASVYAAAGALWYPETGISTIEIAGGSAGTVMQHFADLAARRLRLKMVVATGGTAQIRARAHIKAGS